MSKAKFTAEVPSLGLYLHGNSQEELLDDFIMQLRFMWSEYVLSDVEELTDDALELRNKLNAFIQIKLEN
jgi:hypothetical protein